VTCFDFPGYSNKSSSVLSRRTAFVSGSTLSLEQSALRLLDLAKYSARVDEQSVLGAVEQLRPEMRPNRSPSDVVCDVPWFSRSLRYCLIAFEAGSLLSQEKEYGVWTAVYGFITVSTGLETANGYDA
jgi:hypothetical protein